MFAILAKTDSAFVNIPCGMIEDSVKPEASAALEHEGNIVNISVINFHYNSLIYICTNIQWAD